MKFKARRQNQEDYKQPIEQVEVTIEETALFQSERRRNSNVFEFSNNVVGILEQMSGFVEVGESARPLNNADMMRLSTGKREFNPNLEKFRSHFAQIVKKSLKEYSADQSQTIQAIQDKMLKKTQQNLLPQQPIQYYANPQSRQTSLKPPNDDPCEQQHYLLNQSTHELQTNNSQRNIQQTTLR